MAQKGKGSKRQGKKEDSDNRRQRSSSIEQSGNKPQSGIARREQPANLRTVTPFSLMRRFSEEMDRLFGDFNFAGGLASGFGREFGRLADLEG
ncbi:MAG TPA: hypothetical protein VE977_02670, partial [Pyrinomonadaceae bacterium]|nr:hypothetical protein [Pyrinomonadaceae bacterium]